MTRLMTLLLVLALGGVGLSVREAPAVAQAPTAPAPREKAAPTDPTAADLEEAVRRCREQAAASYRLWRAAATVVELTQDKLALTERAVAKGLAKAADLDNDRAVLEHYWAEAKRAGRAYTVDRDQQHAAEDRLEFTTRRNGADVTGTLAVDVTFPDLARGRVAVAAVDLIRGRPADGGEDVRVEAWDAARRGAHLHLRFPTPRRSVPVLVDGDMLMAELIVPLPLTREPGGVVFVRDVGRVVRVGKLPAAACARFQEALGAAVPVAR